MKSRSRSKASRRPSNTAGRPNRESFADRRARRAEVDDAAVVLEAALRFLETRPRSVAEVRRRLLTAGYQASLVDGAIARLLDLALLDDEGFARAWVESRDRAHPRGQRALRQELAMKGVARETIAGVLVERDESVDDSAAPPDEVAALRLVGRHARTLARIADPSARRQRAYALLARHGFDPETARAVAASVATETPDGADDTPNDE